MSVLLGWAFALGAPLTEWMSFAQPDRKRDRTRAQLAFWAVMVLVMAAEYLLCKALVGFDWHIPPVGGEW